MTKAGIKDSSGTSYYSLYKWLINTPHKGLIAASCVEHAESLILMIDAAVHHDDSAWLILEVHHQAKKATDISFFGKYDLLNISTMGHPSSSAMWPYFMQDRRPKHKQFPTNIWAEYDHTEDGYAFMGFFEKYLNHEKSENFLSERISCFIQSRGQVLSQKIGQDLLLKNMLLIDSAIELIGYPAQIGFLNRGTCTIKLVLEFSRETIQNVAKFCRQHFTSDTLGLFTKGSMLEQVLEGLSTNNTLPRISIDLNLAHGRLSDRLCLEEESTSSRASQQNSSANQSPNVIGLLSTFDFPSYFENYHNSKALESILPYAEKRPSSNLVDSEVICIRHSHRKFTISKDRVDVKDYIHVACSRVNS